MGLSSCDSTYRSVGAPARQHGAYALAKFFRLEQCAEEPCLFFYSPQKRCRIAVQQLSRRGERPLWLVRELARECVRLRGERAVVHDARDDSESTGLLRIQRATEKQQLRGTLPADQERQQQ